MVPLQTLASKAVTYSKRGIFLAGLALYSAVGSATQEDLDADINHYVEIFSGSNFQQQRRALESLSWSGLSTPEIFQKIESRLQSLSDAKSKPEVQEASWFAKALGYSGSEQYKETLVSISKEAKSKKVRKYANQSIINLEQYKTWNPIISDGLIQAPSGRLQQARVANMLAASDPWLVRLGAKRVYHGHKNDAPLIAKAAARLESEYPQAKKSNEAQIDAIAWLIKVLAESGEKQYQPLLNEVAKQSKVKKVKKYAKKYAGYLD